MDEEKMIPYDDVVNYLFDTFYEYEDRDGYKSVRSYCDTLEELIDDFRKTFS